MSIQFTIQNTLYSAQNLIASKAVFNGMFFYYLFIHGFWRWGLVMQPVKHETFDVSNNKRHGSVSSSLFKFDKPIYFLSYCNAQLCIAAHQLVYELLRLFWKHMMMFCSVCGACEWVCDGSPAVQETSGCGFTLWLYRASHGACCLTETFKPCGLKYS